MSKVLVTGDSGFLGSHVIVQLMAAGHEVRDAADLHLRAMTHRDAAGQRFLAVSADCISMLDAATFLREGIGDAASKAPKAEIPDWLMGVMAPWNPRAREVLPNLGKIRNSTSAKAQRMLGWTPRPAGETIVATGKSLIELGLTG